LALEPCVADTAPTIALRGCQHFVQIWQWPRDKESLHGTHATTIWFLTSPLLSKKLIPMLKPTDEVVRASNSATPPVERGLSNPDGPVVAELGARNEPGWKSSHDPALINAVGRCCARRVGREKPHESRRL
jgi:hypothetical protein